MNEKKNLSNSNFIGMLSSALCLVHCIAVPLFMGWYAIQENYHDHAGHAHTHAHATVGGFNMDYFFILVCLVAVLFSTRNHHTTPVLKVLLWAFFGLFAIGILFEAYAPVFQYLGYIASLGLIGVHWYNYKLCQKAH